MKYEKDKDGNVYQIQRCPFCGMDVAEIWTQSERDESPIDPEMYAIVCSKFKKGCGALSGWFNSPQKAVSRWNTRVVI